MVGASRERRGRQAVFVRWQILLKVARAEPFPVGVDTGSLGSVGSLAQQIQLEAAQIRMAKRQQDQQGQAALQLIESATPVAIDGNVGRLLNVVA